MRPSLLAAFVCFAVCLACPGAARAEPQTEVDLRLLDFFVGSNPRTTAGGYLAGVHVGEAYWFTDRAGLHAMGGAEVGFLYLAGNSGSDVPADGTASFSAEVGLVLLLGGDSHTSTSATVMSLSWAPRALVNFVGGEVASPVAGEVSLRSGIFKVPVWFMKSNDGTTFGGAGLGFQF
jgi:hypothetical protein